MLQLAVAVKETEYIRRLADYVRESPIGSEWRITGFTSTASLRQFLKGGYRVDLLAMQPEFRETLGAQYEGIPSVIFEKTFTGNREDDLPRIRQFQPLPELFAELFAVHQAASGGRRTSSMAVEGSCVVAVCSAVGGIGKTTLSVHLADLASKNRMNVFYVNLELWNASGLYFGGEQEDALPRLLYTLQAEPELAGEQLAKLKRRHADIGADYLPAAPNPGERLALSPDVFRALIDTIAAGGTYDLIVVDTDGLPDELFAAIMERSSRIVWLTSEAPAVRRKTDIALRYCRLRWGETFHQAERKMGFVTVRQTEGTPPEPADLPFVGRWAAGGLSSPAQAPPVYRAAVQSLLAALTGREEAADERGDGVGAAHAARYGSQPD